MGKKLTVVFISTILSVSLFVGQFSSVKAAEIRKVEKVTQYNEVMDIQTLLQMAIVKKQNETKVRTADDKLTVTQLIEKREYTDGSYEEDYATTNIVILDKNNNVVPASAIISSGTSSGENMMDMYGLEIYTTAYYSYRADESEVLNGQYKLNKMQSTLVNADRCSVAPVSAELKGAYDPTLDRYKQSTTVSINRALNVQNFSFTFTNFPYLDSSSGWPFVIFANTIVTFKDGSRNDAIAYVPGI